jgi:hypothetical protein
LLITGLPEVFLLGFLNKEEICTDFLKFLTTESAVSFPIYSG